MKRLIILVFAFCLSAHAQILSPVIYGKAPVAGGPAPSCILNGAVMTGSYFDPTYDLTLDTALTAGRPAAVFVFRSDPSIVVSVTDNASTPNTYTARTSVTDGDGHGKMWIFTADNVLAATHVIVTVNSGGSGGGSDIYVASCTNMATSAYDNASSQVYSPYETCDPQGCYFESPALTPSGTGANTRVLFGFGSGYGYDPTFTHTAGTGWTRLSNLSTAGSFIEWRLGVGGTSYTASGYNDGSALTSDVAYGSILSLKGQ